MKIQWKKLCICILIPLLVGGIAGFISQDGMNTFQHLAKPPLSPPGWLFPVVWTILYLLMGIASYLILTSQAPQKSIVNSLKLYGNSFLTFFGPFGFLIWDYIFLPLYGL